MFFRKNIKHIVVVFVLLAVIFISFRFGDNPVKGFVLGVSSPFLKTFRIFSGGISGFFDFLGSIGELKKENEKLISENQSLLVENNFLKGAEKENISLRQQLDLAPRKNFDLEASFVIGQDPQGFGNYLLIDKGEDVGIRVGMPAIISDGILVGRVSEAHKNTSKITLITDPESVINAESQETRTKGIVRGEYGLGLKMDMISQADIINDGDAVVTSGLGGEVPRGLTIGKISGISQSADKLFQEASIIPAADFSSLRVVFIIKK